jgi:hypothetical protein
MTPTTTGTRPHPFGPCAALCRRSWCGSQGTPQPWLRGPGTGRGAVSRLRSETLPTIGKAGLPAVSMTAGEVDGQSRGRAGCRQETWWRAKVAFVTDGDLAERLAGIASLADPLRRDLYIYVSAQPAPVTNAGIRVTSERGTTRVENPEIRRPGYRVRVVPCERPGCCAHLHTIPANLQSRAPLTETHLLPTLGKGGLITFAEGGLRRLCAQACSWSLCGVPAASMPSSSLRQSGQSGLVVVLALPLRATPRPIHAIALAIALSLTVTSGQLTSTAAHVARTRRPPAVPTLASPTEVR